MKLPHKNLNPDPCPLHLTSIYTYRVIIVLKVCGDNFMLK